VIASPSSAAKPLDVTVLIPAYNRVGLIERAIASVRAQRPAPPKELIVVDDASSDDTAAIAEGLGAKVIRHQRNRGPSGARNTGLEAAGQTWVALLDSDDEWMPDHLHTLWSLREGHVLAADSILYVTPTKRRWQGAVSRRPTVLRSPGRLLFPENFVSHSSVMLRRDVALAAGGYPEDMGHVEDLDFLVRVLEHGTGVVASDVGAIYHGHDGQRSLDRVQMRAVHRETIAQYAGRPWWTEGLLRDWDGVCAWDDARLALSEGRRADALRHLGRLLRSPRRSTAVARMLLWRWRGRRQTARLSPA
jgi:glycosyltransferase involved in cell wall biosynthesis